MTSEHKAHNGRPEVNTEQPLAQINDGKSEGHNPNTTPAPGQAALVADPRNRPDNKNGIEKDQEGTKPEDLNSSNDD